MQHYYIVRDADDREVAHGITPDDLMAVVARLAGGRPWGWAQRPWDPTAHEAVSAGRVIARAWEIA